MNKYRTPKAPSKIAQVHFVKPFERWLDVQDTRTQGQTITFTAARLLLHQEKEFEQLVANKTVVQIEVAGDGAKYSMIGRAIECGREHFGNQGGYHPWLKLQVIENLETQLYETAECRRYNGVVSYLEQCQENDIAPVKNGRLQMGVE